MTSLDKAILLLEAGPIVNDSRIKAEMDRECELIEAEIADSERFLEQLRGKYENQSGRVTRID